MFTEKSLKGKGRFREKQPGRSLGHSPHSCDHRFLQIQISATSQTCFEHLSVDGGQESAVADCLSSLNCCGRDIHLLGSPLFADSTLLLLGKIELFFWVNSYASSLQDAFPPRSAKPLSFFSHIRLPTWGNNSSVLSLSGSKCCPGLAHGYFAFPLSADG